MHTSMFPRIRPATSALLSGPLLLLLGGAGCNDTQLVPHYREPLVSFVSPHSGDQLPSAESMVFVAAVSAENPLSELDYLWYLNGDPTQVIGGQRDTVIIDDEHVSLTVAAGLDIDVSRVSLRVEDIRQERATDTLSSLRITPNKPPEVQVLQPYDDDVWVLATTNETFDVDVVVEIDDAHESGPEGLTIRWMLDGVEVSGPMHPELEGGRYLARTTLHQLGLRGDELQRVGLLSVEAVDSLGLSATDTQGVAMTVCDLDGDGFAAIDHAEYCLDAWDCDDTNATIHPGAEERCDGLDTDCDGRLGDDERDEDGDGHMVCMGDCLDTPDHPLASEVYPGDHLEVCNNGVDDNCNTHAEQCAWDEDAEINAHLRTGPANSGAAAGMAAGDVYLDGFGADGYSDLLIGVPEAMDGYGAVYLLLGSAALEVDDTNTSWGRQAMGDAAAVRFIGPDSNEGIGSAVGMGDLNGDGHTDFVLGAGTAYDDADEYNHQVGAVYVVYGPVADGDEITVTGNEAGQQVIVGQKPDQIGEHLGAALAVGDVTGDGIDDLVVGAPYNRQNDMKQAGAVYVWVGSTEGLDIDGGPDISIYGTGAVMSSSGSIPQTKQSVRLGDSLTIANVLDGDDSRAEIIVGAPYAHTVAAGGTELANAGAVLVYTVGTGDLGLDEGDAACTFLGEDTNGALGTALASEDVDGDGLADLLMGAPGATMGDGAVFLVNATECAIGAIGLVGSIAEAVWQGEEDSGVGASLAISDLDGDGELDVFMGAPGWETDATYTNAGATYLTYGPLQGSVDLSVSRDAMWSGTERQSELGTGMLGAGDLNNDGLADVAISAPGAVSGDGGVYLLMGLGY